MTGHRKRLMERYSSGGLKSLLDYEKLELFLTFLIPRKDTKCIAKNLMEEFGTINRVLNAETEPLNRVSGLGGKTVSKIKFLKDFLNLCLLEKERKKTIIDNKKDVLDYFRMKIGFISVETVYLILLNSSNEILHLKRVSEGSVNRCAVYPRKIIELALNYGAASLILIHNHPGGILKPSASDWQLTKNLYSISRMMDLKLLDHLIITASDCISMRDLKEWSF